MFCSRYFETDVALGSHRRSKVHKRRLKQLKETPYTIEESERAAGLGKEGKKSLLATMPVDVVRLVTMPLS
jgi:bud site selection protein 20